MKSGFVAYAAILSASLLGATLGPFGAAAVPGLVLVFVVASVGARRRRPHPLPATEGVRVFIPKLEAPVDYRPLLLASLAIHVLLAVVLEIVGFPDELAPDGYTYRYFGALIAAHWSRNTVDPSTMEGWQAHALYPHLNGIVAYVFGVKAIPLVMSFVNACIGTIAAWNVGRIAEGLYGPKAGRIAFFLCAFFPSILVWTSMNLKDGWSFFFLSGAMLALQRLKTRLSAGDAILLCAYVTGMPFIRSYLFMMFAASAALSFVVLRARNIPAMIVGVVVLFAMLRLLTDSVGWEYYTSANLETLQNIRQGFAQTGNTTYDADADISTPLGALAYLPRGIAIFLLAPFPWSVVSWHQAIAVPESFIWYVVFWRAVRGIWADVRARLSRASAPLFFIILTTILYGLTESNQGSAFRHRAQVMIFLFVFAAGELARKQAVHPRHAVLAVAAAGRE